MNCDISKLSNGIRVLTVPMKERRSAAVGVWVGVGGRDEEPRLNGVSHFLEHIVFKGTSTRTANQIKEEVEGSGGSLNAFTSEECTCFLAKSASRNFEGTFDVLADMVLNASITKADVDKERTVVQEEIKMTQDQPGQHAEEILSEMLWPDHPLGWPLTGTHETVGAMSPEDMRGYRDKNYNPSTITVAAAGDVTPKRVMEAAQRLFGAVKPGAKKPLSLFQERKNGKPAVRVLRKPIEQTHLALGLRTFQKEHPDEFALDVLSILLGGNMSSRLFNEVREERGLAYDIGSSVRKYHETGAFVVSAGTDAKKLREALGVIVAELRKIASAAPDAGEIRRAKDFYLGQLDLSLENTMNAMLWAGESMTSLGRIRGPEEVSKGVEKVTPDDLKRVADSLLRGRGFDLTVVGPVAEGAERDLEAVLAS